MKSTLRENQLQGKRCRSGGEGEVSRGGCS